jgi:hypothetical protein
MNKLIVSLIMFVSISLIGLAQPKFVIIGGDEYNWGKVKIKDSPAKASVTFKNEGTENLIILKVKTSCGCTAAKPEKDTLLPGDTTVMNVELRLSGNGLSSKTVTIETNDPAKKTTNYKLVYDIVRDIIFKPSEHVSFKSENVMVGKEVSESIFIKNNTKENIRFSDLRIEPDILKLTVPNDFNLKPDEEVEMIIRTTPTKEGPFHSNINFNTNNADYPTISINVYGHAHPNPLLNEIESDPKIKQ